MSDAEALDVIRQVLDEAVGWGTIQIGIEDDVIWVGDGPEDPERMQWAIEDPKAPLNRLRMIVWALENGAKLVIEKP